MAASEKHMKIYTFPHWRARWERDRTARHAFPNCGRNAWAKPGSNLICDGCYDQGKGEIHVMVMDVPSEIPNPFFTATLPVCKFCNPLEATSLRDHGACVVFCPFPLRDVDRGCPPFEGCASQTLPGPISLSHLLRPHTLRSSLTTIDHRTFSE